MLSLEFSAFAIVLQYFVIADSVRAVAPGFRMTFIMFVLLCAVKFGCNVIVEVACLALIVPGIYLGVKLALWVPYVLFGDSDALANSFRDTTGAFWETVCLNSIAWFVVGAGFFLTYFVAFVAVEVFHPLAVLVAPLATAGGLYFATVSWLMWIYWADALRELRAPARLGVIRWPSQVG